MSRFVLFIFLFLGSSVAFASDNESKLGITERLRQISEEKNSAIIFPNKPFGIYLGMPLNEEEIEIFDGEEREGAVIHQIMPEKDNINFSNYWAVVSTHNSNAFQVTALSSTRFKRRETCLLQRDALFKPLFRKYQLGSRKNQANSILSFETIGKIDGKAAHYQVSLDCSRDEYSKLRLRLIYVDVLLLEESAEAFKTSLKPDISNL